MPDALAQKACEIEIEKAGSPIGKQDQYAAAFGGLNVINFDTNGKIRVSSVSLAPETKDAFQKHLLFFFTGKERSANTILSEQKQNIKKKFDFLKRMSDMVPIFESTVREGNFKEAGKILHENWMLKRELASGISNPQIEQMYELALKSGAFGGKILGAGGGGFLLIMAPPEKHFQIIESLEDYKQAFFRFTEAGSKIVFKC